MENPKPKLVILNTSGGGLRSALWTFTVLSNCDEILNQNLSKHLQMITGASGGMIGAAFYRELILRKELGQIKDKNRSVYKEMLGKDLLNKLSFSASTSDLFMRYKKMSYQGKQYTLERGSEFDKQLHNYLNYSSAAEKDNAEIFSGLTYRSANALGLNDRGIIEPNRIADFIGFKLPDYREILYNQGKIKPSFICKRGKVYNK